MTITAVRPPSPSQLAYYAAAPRFPCTTGEHAAAFHYSPTDLPLTQRVAAAAGFPCDSMEQSETPHDQAASPERFSVPVLDDRDFVNFSLIERTAAAALATLQQTIDSAAAAPGSQESPPQPSLTPREREYRVRATIERRDPLNPEALLPNRLEYSLQRARDQMASQPATPRFRFQLPRPEPEVSYQFPVIRLRTQELVVGGMEVGISADIGNYRHSMEDTHVAAEFVLSLAGRDLPCVLFGVFDGHGGAATSFFVQQHIEEVLQQLILAHNQEGISDVGMYNALKLLGVHLNERFNREHPYGMEIGTTLVASLFINGDLYVVNIGDSRALLNLNGTPLQLSEDQKPGDPYYERMITERGGYVSTSSSCWGGPPSPARVNGVLATARAIGDANCGPEFSLSARSKVTKFSLEQIPPESHLVLVSDGVTDVANTASLVAAIHEHRELSPENLSKGLVHSAIETGSLDNVTAIVVRLR